MSSTTPNKTSDAKPFTMRQKLRYEFDNRLAAGTRGIVLWLGLATVALVVVAATISAILEVVVDDKPVGFAEAVWLALLRTLDPGTMGSDEGNVFRAISLAVTIGGVLIVSSLIGLLATGVNRLVMQLSRGKSSVAESDHTLILGWSPKALTIIQEIVHANESQGGGVIVVLAPQDKAHMEEDLRTRVGSTGRTRVVIRTGTPYEPSDLSIVNPRYAKSIIALRPDDPDGDAVVVKTALLLATRGIANSRRPCLTELHSADMVAELKMAVAGAAIVVQPSDLIARITAQACRRIGVSSVYQNLLDFEGDEVYFERLPEAVGKTFGEVLLRLDHATLIGLRDPDGSVTLRPDMNRTIGPDDQLVVISEDNGAAVFTESRWSENGETPPRTMDEEPERVLLVGWSEIGPRVIRDLDKYAPQGSEVHIVVRSTDDPVPGRLGDTLTALDLVTAELGPTDEGFEEYVSRAGFDHVVLLADRKSGDPSVADARNLMSLLRIRRCTANQPKDVNIVTELLDERDISLAPPTSVEEFVVSERLTSLLLAQLSENPELAFVFDELLNETGCEIYLKPAARYVTVDEKIEFGRVVAAAKAVGDIAIGYTVWSANGADDKHLEVAVNPSKDEARAFGAQDHIVVLSETG